MHFTALQCQQRDRSSVTNGLPCGTARLGTDMNQGEWVLRNTGITAEGHRYRVVVSRQLDIRSPRILEDLELSCLLYCRLNLVVHSSKVTQILYSTCLLICAHGAITMAGER